MNRPIPPWWPWPRSWTAYARSPLPVGTSHTSVRAFEEKCRRHIGPLPASMRYVSGGVGTAEEPDGTISRGIGWNNRPGLTRGTLDFQDKFDNIAPLKPTAILV